MFEGILKRAKQETLALKLTKQAVKLYRIAEEKNWGAEMLHEIFLLIAAVARREMPGAIVDDFSEPGLFVVTNNIRRVSL